MALAACGGGNDGSNNLNPSTPQTAQGVFVDAPVAGLHYVSGSVSGTTDAAGHFNYVPGQSVIFSVGGVSIGSATGQAVVTPLALVPNAAGVTDDTVTNIGAFLQSLDSGGNPVSRIQISAASVAALSSTQLNFAQTPAAFAADPAVIAAIQAASPQKALVSPAAAQAHMQSQNMCLFAGQWQFNHADRSDDTFVATINEVDGSFSSTVTHADGTQAHLDGSVLYVPAMQKWVFTASSAQQVLNSTIGNIDFLTGSFSGPDWSAAVGTYTKDDPTSVFGAPWTATRLSPAPACDPTASTPVVPQGAVGYADYHYNALGMAPSIATILDRGVGAAGTLNLGSQAITVTPQPDGGFLWGSPVQYGMNFSSLASDPNLPAASMVCMAANVGDGTDGLKSTDVLVAQTASKVTSATDLAGITFSQYWEDCRRDGLPAATPASVHSSIAVDTSGNATLTIEGQTPVTLTAGKLTALLSGVPASAVGLPGNAWFQAVRFVSAGRTRFAIVEHGANPGNTNRGYVGVWVQ
ncbi:hypothetical protein [Ralstonia insidiosa]|uniref:Uncharacterized protein n=2 Tax=Ralstonia insidiosa TaxID=190721 RepID=A0A848NZQ7_9RALS|nr:hypothetical protein [Ralstonia insidiosa]NMV38555.1 hypothetical protein [Ralstonia insidiosa]